MRLAGSGLAARAAGIVVLGALAACGQEDGAAQAPPATEAAADPDAPAALETIPYEVVFEGVDDSSLESLLREASGAAGRVDTPPQSVAILERRARDDLPVLVQALNSRGYFDGTADARVDASVRPAVVRFTVTPGAVYRFADVRAEVTPPDGGFAPPSPVDLGLNPGDPALSRAILDAEQRLLTAARNAGYALARTGELSAVIDRAAKTMNVTLRLDSGRRAAFGDVAFRGARTVDETFLRSLIPWRPGDRYDPEVQEEARQELVNTNLFASVRLEPGATLTPDGRLPFTATLTERKHRSIGGGLSFRTDEGPGANAFWENRNLFGQGENLRLELDLSTIEQRLLANYREPYFLRPDQSLLVEGAFDREDTDAYQTLSALAGVGVERAFTPRLTGSLGVRYRLVQDEEQGDQEGGTFGLLSLPAKLTWDTSDDLFDPTRGGRLDLEAAPYLETLGDKVVFGRARVAYSRYFQVSDRPWLVLAGRVGFGSLFGVDRDQVPSDELFYAGGGGSVRGYGYQLVGPLDDENDPIGGRSLFDSSFEVRTRFTDTIGGVVFLDAGAAFEDPLPQGASAVRFGSGVGLRYLTPIGPLRADVGVPLNPRDGVDDAFQLYISIGQAF